MWPPELLGVRTGFTRRRVGAKWAGLPSVDALPIPLASSSVANRFIRSLESRGDAHLLSPTTSVLNPPVVPAMGVVAGGLPPIGHSSLCGAKSGGAVQDDGGHLFPLLRGLTWLGTSTAISHRHKSALTDTAAGIGKSLTVDGAPAAESISQNHPSRQTNVLVPTRRLRCCRRRSLASSRYCRCISVTCPTAPL
jgi:hypothetical protein